MPCPIQSLPQPDMVDLDCLAAWQKRMSDAILRLERRRHLMLLRPGCDGRLAAVDRAIERRYHWLERLETAERKALRSRAPHLPARDDAARHRSTPTEDSMHFKPRLGLRLSSLLGSPSARTDNDDDERARRRSRKADDDETDEERDRRRTRARRADDDEEEDDDEDDAVAKAARSRERARCAAILGAEAAEGREPAACHLAFNTSMSARRAVALLGGLGNSRAFSGGASGTRGIQRSWDKALENASASPALASGLGQPPKACPSIQSAWDRAFRRTAVTRKDPIR